jgi:ATP synthase I subunit
VTPDASSALIRRLQIGALAWTAVAIVAALIGWPSRTDVMLGIAGGGLLSFASFYAIRASVDALLPAAGPGRRAGAAVKLAGRYGLLALLAYVMIARLRLHPLGLMVGATALVASATAEAVRGLGRRGPAS